MDESTALLITLGALFLLGVLGDYLGRVTRLPSVTLLLLLGVAVGPSGFDAIPEERDEWFPVVTNVALVMIGFLLGHGFTKKELREHGREVLSIALVQAVGAGLLVAGGLWLAGVDRTVALLLGGIATATAPAATTALVQARERPGRFSQTLLGVVALDDIFGLLLYSLLAAVASVLAGSDESSATLLVEAGREIGGGVLLGVVLAIPVAALSGRIRAGEPTREEAIGIVLLAAGLAEWMEVSGLIAAVVLGSGVANLAKHHERQFHEIEDIERPFLVLFFILGGAALELDALGDGGLVVLGYIVLRVVGKIGGAWLGGAAVGSEAKTQRWLGLALLPQAGVALGLALDASERFPEVADEVLPVAILATVIFEVVGSLLTQVALDRADEPPPDGDAIEATGAATAPD